MKKEEKKIEVSSINITVADKKFTMKVEDAMRLQAALNDLFRTTEIKETHHHHYDWWWNQPVVPSTPMWTISYAPDTISISNNAGTYGEDGKVSLTTATVVDFANNCVSLTI